MLAHLPVRSDVPALSLPIDDAGANDPQAACYGPPADPPHWKKGRSLRFARCSKTNVVSGIVPPETTCNSLGFGIKACLPEVGPGF